LTIIKGSAPYVLGLVEGGGSRMLNYIYARIQLKGVILTVENAMEIIERNKLWKNIAILIAWQLQLFSARDQEVTSVDARTMIKAKIIERYTLEENNGSHLNIVDYVQQRTKLGQSINYLFDTF
jgi:ferric iron reductase protein FhuF